MGNKRKGVGERVGEGGLGSTAAPGGKEAEGERGRRK